MKLKKPIAKLKSKEINLGAGDKMFVVKKKKTKKTKKTKK